MTSGPEGITATGTERPAQQTRRDFLQQITKTVIGGGLLIGAVTMPTRTMAGVCWKCDNQSNSCNNSDSCGSDSCGTDSCISSDACSTTNSCISDNCTGSNQCFGSNTCTTDTCGSDQCYGSNTCATDTCASNNSCGSVNLCHTDDSCAGSTNECSTTNYCEYSDGCNAWAAVNSCPKVQQLQQ